MGLDGRLALSDNLYEQMYACFACMACNEACPVGIRPAEAALSMRSMQEELRPRAWKELVFGRVVSDAGRLEAATLPLRLYEHLGVRRFVHRLGLSRLLPARLRDCEAMLPRLPQRPLRRVLPEVTEARGPARYRVGFFLGCAQSLLFAEESAAAVRVLARNGCTVVTPKDVQCCGMPARAYGRTDLLEVHARHNVDVFGRHDLDAIVTDCATCGSTLKEYGSLLDGDAEWAPRAQAFGRKVRDVSEFLAELPALELRGRTRAKVTYHDPCHLRRAQRVWKEPRKLLAGIDGLELVELPEADWCCGSAGSQLVTHYETSSKVLDRKVDTIARTGADIVATGCPACRMQLDAGLRRRGLRVRVVHPVTLLDEAQESADG
jgi:glycolate oxidase iron-sulfur subunit